MGARAVVAYDRTDGYDLHRSQWGATRLALRWRLTPATPFGGGNPPPVDPTPTRTAVDGSAVAASVDPLTDEALYVVDKSFDVDAYLVASCDVPGCPEPSGSRTGLLVEPAQDEPDGCKLRARIEGTRSAAAALLNVISPDPGTEQSTRHHHVTSLPLVRRAIRDSIDEWATQTHSLRAVDDETF